MSRLNRKIASPKMLDPNDPGTFHNHQDIIYTVHDSHGVDPLLRALYREHGYPRPDHYSSFLIKVR